MNLTINETNLITEIRKISHGVVVIVMHEGQPDRIEKAIEKKKLGAATKKK